MNRQIVLKSRPEGMPDSGNFEIREAPIHMLQKGELLVRAKLFSVDPYMRGKMRSEPSGIVPFELGKPLEGAGIAEIMESEDVAFQQGELVKANLLWQESQVLKPIDVIPIKKDEHSPADYLGILGMTGLTAYFGLLMIGKPIKGETVVVSGAAGAVGNVAGQIARIKGCRVIGIAGSSEKISFLLEELHFDEVYNYRQPGWEQSFLENNSHKVNIYFDNVGGEISDVVMQCLSMRARVIICGQISQYNSSTNTTGPRLQPILLDKKALMQGFTVKNYTDHYEEAIQELSSWLKARKIISRQTVLKGFEQLPQALIGLFKGNNTGKCLVET